MDRTETLKGTQEFMTIKSNTLKTGTSYGIHTNPLSLHSETSPILVEKVCDTKKSANEAMISMVDISGDGNDHMNFYQSFQRTAKVNDFIYQRTVNKEASSKNSLPKREIW